MITVEQLTFRYYKKASQATLDNLNFTLEKGERVGLIGANGAGKSTLLKLLVGLLLDYEGHIMVDGMPVQSRHLSEIRKRIGYVFQDSESQLFMPTVYEDVAFAPRNYGYSKEVVGQRVDAAIRAVHMEQNKDKQIYRLSGGEKKLAAIATILSVEPEVILLDEPSVALDPKNRRNLIHILNGLPATKIIASHDLDFIYDTCERVLLLSEGQIVADGNTREILTNQMLLEEHGLELPLSFSRIE